MHTHSKSKGVCFIEIQPIVHVPVESEWVQVGELFTDAAEHANEVASTLS